MATHETHLIHVTRQIQQALLGSFVNFILSRMRQFFQHEMESYSRTITRFKRPFIGSRPKYSRLPLQG